MLGSIAPEELGNTQMHERISPYLLSSLHLFNSFNFSLLAIIDIFIKYTKFFEEPTDPKEKELANKPFSMDHIHWIQYNYNKSLPNLTLDEFQVACKIAKLTSITDLLCRLPKESYCFSNNMVERLSLVLYPFYFSISHPKYHFTHRGHNSWNWTKSRFS